MSKSDIAVHDVSETLNAALEIGHDPFDAIVDLFGANDLFSPLSFNEGDEDSGDDDDENNEGEVDDSNEGDEANEGDEDA
nr:hypothetical protein [uncultured Devosia sp.]